MIHFVCSWNIFLAVYLEQQTKHWHGSVCAELQWEKSPIYTKSWEMTQNRTSGKKDIETVITYAVLETNNNHFLCYYKKSCQSTFDIWLSSWGCSICKKSKSMKKNVGEIRNKSHFGALNTVFVDAAVNILYFDCNVTSY